MKKSLFGHLSDGKEIYLYELNSGTLTLEVITYGGIIRTLSKDGIDMICGYDTLDEYVNDDSCQGALIGRYANRIKEGRFTVGGIDYQVAKNDHGKNHLHGGNIGFNRKVWRVEEANDCQITLSLFSPDGEENYPGNLTLKVTYTITDYALIIDYDAVCDRECPLNFTNHAYFNISGTGNGTILDNIVMINADEFSEIDDELIPSGKHLPVDGTPFDFRTPRTVGEKLGGEVTGYDHNFILRGTPACDVCGRQLALAATVENGVHKLSTYTDKPCMQLYTANGMTGRVFKGGIERKPQSALCLETQYEPNSPQFGKAIYKAGEPYHFTTIYSIEKL